MRSRQFSFEPPTLSAAFEAVRERYPEIYVVVSPPRCSSTAFSRVFWEHPSIRYYCHEPFEIAYYRDASVQQVAAQLATPLDLLPVKGHRPEPDAAALVVKEMPYQVGTHFRLLAALTRHPIIFLLRDPRLNIASRIEKKLEVGDSPVFPEIETGWELLAAQIECCREREIDHLVVSADAFRNRPREVFPEIFASLGMSFAPEMLDWRACADVQIDNLGGDHSHLYRAVLSSTGLTPEVDPPPIDWFPVAGGLQDHVARCVEIYRELQLTTIAG